MKALKQTQLVEICEATAANIRTATLLFGKTFPEDPAWITDGISKGFYQAATVRADGCDKFLIVYHVTDQQTLNVNAAAQLTPQASTFEVLMDGMVSLAKAKACKAVEGVTIRAGVLKKLLAAGFQPAGVSVYFAI